jgi:hypothetical protein
MTQSFCNGERCTRPGKLVASCAGSRASRFTPSTKWSISDCPHHAQQIPGLLAKRPERLVYFESTALAPKAAVQLHTGHRVSPEIRSRREMTIAYDGGLKHGISTFGWKIMNQQGIHLFSGSSGLIDGPQDSAKQFYRVGTRGHCFIYAVVRFFSAILGHLTRVQMQMAD